MSQAEQFFSELYRGQNGVLELRTFDHPQANRLRTFVPVKDGEFDFTHVQRFLKETEALQLGAFFGVALRTAASLKTRKGDLAHCQTLTTLFVDADFKHLGEEKTRDGIKAFSQPPSMLVHSGGGLHPYWLLEYPIFLQGTGGIPKAKSYLKRLAKSVADVVDESVSEPVRVLRIPGSFNFKKHYDTPRPVTLERCPAFRYKLDDIEAVLAEMGAPTEAETQAAQKEGFKVPENIRSGDRHEMLYKLLRSQKARGISLEASLATCHAENKAKCDPPIEFNELDKYLERVWEQPDSPTFVQRTNTADDFKPTEAGDAEFFAALYSDHLRYDHRRGRWLLFSDHRWKPQTNGEVQRLALASQRARQAAAVALGGDDDRRPQRRQWANGGESRKRLSNLIAIAQSVEPLADAGDNWDTNPWLLGVTNGVVDLTTGELRAGQPTDRITMSAQVAYDPHATCPLWDTTIDEIFDGDDELISYFDRYLGYSLTGDCREETLALCWGDGANGKGTTMNTFAWLLGDYADDLPFSALELHDRGGNTNDIAKIAGKRFVTSSETAETARLNEARVKALTGRDPITARFLHREFFTFQPIAKFWLATNQKPVVRDTSIGFWRRIHLIPFTQSFAARPNLQLKDKLREEGPGILARAVRGCLAWQRHGLNPPAVVQKATSDYRDESDPLTPFLDARCLELPGKRVQSSHLFKEYQRWCDDAQLPKWERLSMTAFGVQMKKRFRFEDGRQVFYLDVCLRVDEATTNLPAGMDVRHVD